jgi:diadenylate cyclase
MIIPMTMTNIVPYLKVALEIGLLWYFVYMILLFIEGTRTEQLLKGVIVVMIIFVLTQQLHLTALNWIMARLFPLSVLALVIIFQPELRRGLAQLGQFGVFSNDAEAIEDISRAAFVMQSSKTGALMVIERESGLKTYIETGVVIDSKVGIELLVSIFSTKGPLHDGAVIIRGDRIVAAKCVLPLSQEIKEYAKSHGTRHRAALGLSEETDAICVVVSEETGAISVVHSGNLTRCHNREALLKMLKELSYARKPVRALNFRLLSRITPKVNSKTE